jgi:hypothetical protein
VITRIALATATILAAAAGCSGTARGLEAYRNDTQALLATHNAQLQVCYDDALKADAKASGKVAIQFVVEKKTGEITHAAIDPKQTTAPQALGDCVLKAVAGLKLDPPDRDEGHATFVYEFKPAPAPAAS